MRIKALSLLLAASLVSVSPANDEITRLLADLSFGDAVTVDESAAVSEEASQPVDAAVDVEEAVDTEDEVELPEIKSDEFLSRIWKTRGHRQVIDTNCHPLNRVRSGIQLV